MSDKYRIDSHKLILHPKRVSEWVDTGDVYPIYIEVSPIGSCNHRCVFCGLDFMEYKPVKLDKEQFSVRLKEMGQLGVKSIMYAGEGEPFLHKDMPEITKATKEAGIDVSFTTNGVLLSERIAEEILPVTSWIKVSLNAGSAQTYSKIHRTKESDFDKVFTNLEKASTLKSRNNWECTIGAQSLLLPENAGEMGELARLARDAGLNYLVVKPYSQHPQSLTHVYENVKYDGYTDMAEMLKELETDSFKVVFRMNTMKKWDEGNRTYDICQALPFWSYIDASGKVWGCSVYLGKDEFYYGDLNQNSFEEIWQSDVRKKSLEYVAKELDCSQCRVNCRMDEVNRYLWELKNPGGHVNFI